MHHTRRQFVVGAGTVALGALGIGTNVLADGHEVPVFITEVDAFKDTVTLENRGDEAVDLTDYHINWEYANDAATQEDDFPAGTQIDAGATLVVWSGYLASKLDSVEHDVIVGDEEPGNGRVRDNEEDVIALVAPNGEAVATSAGEVSPPDDGGGDGDGDEGDGDDGDGDGDGDDDGADEDEEPVEEEEDDEDEEDDEEEEDDEDEEDDEEEEEEEDEEDEEEEEEEEDDEDEEEEEDDEDDEDEEKAGEETDEDDC